MPPSQRAQEDAALIATDPRRSTRLSRGTYGAPRVHAELREAGVASGRKRVARLMRSAGLRGRQPAAVRRHDACGTAARPAPDLVERDFAADGPNQLWVADITYIPTWAGFLYLAVVLDVWSRRIVGWAMATHLRTELVLDALDMALWQRRPSGVIHHSDQGCQYTSIAFGKRCREAGVRPSMGSVGDCLRQRHGGELLRHARVRAARPARFKTQAEARMAVFDFIEGFYNPRRRHSSLGYLSPIDVRAPPRGERS